MTNFQTIKLAAGKHKAGGREACLLEVTSMLAGEEFTDHPECACPALSDLGRWLNDCCLSADRQRLLPFTARLVGSRDDSKRLERAYAVQELVDRGEVMTGRDFWEAGFNLLDEHLPPAPEMEFDWAAVEKELACV